MSPSTGYPDDACGYFAQLDADSERHSGWLRHKITVSRLERAELLWAARQRAAEALAVRGDPGAESHRVIALLIPYSDSGPGPQRFMRAAACADCDWLNESTTVRGLRAAGVRAVVLIRRDWDGADWIEEIDVVIEALEVANLLALLETGEAGVEP